MSDAFEYSSHLSLQVGSMALSRVQVDNPMALVRAAAWCNLVASMGVHLPLFLVHDIGILLTNRVDSAGLSIGARAAQLAEIGVPAEVQASLKDYETLLRKLATSEVVSQLAGMRLRDELVGVLLVRLLSDLSQEASPNPFSIGAELLPLNSRRFSEDPARALRAHDLTAIWAFIRLLSEREMHIYTHAELIDLDTVRLLGLFREDSASGAGSLAGNIDLVDLFGAMDSSEAGNIANFSLDLLPSVLETKRASGAQTFSIDGYSSLERRGQIDSLMLSELAYDQEIFEQKVVDHELLYFGRERQREEEHRLQYILVDASASMRGKRQVFARGLALTLIKKLSLQGDEVWFRFFDSRLHETIKTTPFPVPYLLSFRSERGRNYSRVLKQLLVEIEKLKNEQKRDVVVYFITHGQCHFSPEEIAALGQLAYLYGIIILPSSELNLDFLPFLHRQQIVEGHSLDSRRERRERALGIVDDATEDTKSVGDNSDGLGPGGVL